MMRCFLAAALALASAPLFATTYILEARHTDGVIHWNHLGFANLSAQFSQVQGTLTFDPADPTKASVAATIPLTKINTGVPDLDEDFRSDAFFDYAKFPSATFRSTKIEKAAAANHFTVSGELNLHGVIKPVVLDVTLNKIGVNPRNQLPTIGFDASTTLKRSDFGLGRFVPQVSDEVKIDISAEAAEAEGYAKLIKKEAEQDAEAVIAQAQNAANDKK